MTEAQEAADLAYWKEVAIHKQGTSYWRQGGGSNYRFSLDHGYWAKYGGADSQSKIADLIAQTVVTGTRIVSAANSRVIFYRLEYRGYFLYAMFLDDELLDAWPDSI